MDYFIFRMEYQMTDSELDTLFADLAECLGPDYIEAPTIAAAHGETILLFVSAIDVSIFSALYTDILLDNHSQIECVLCL